MDLPIVTQGTCHQVHITLRKEYLLVEPLTVNNNLSHHPEDVGLHVVASYRATGLALMVCVEVILQRAEF